MVALGGVPIESFNANVLRDLIYQRQLKNEKTLLFFANTNFIVKSQEMLPQLYQPGVIIVNDGIGVDIGCWLKYKKKFPDNLNGTDFVPHYFENKPTCKIYLIGSTAFDLAKAKHYFEQTLGQDIVGVCDGFDGIKSLQLIDNINASGAEVILVGMGNPLQEAWIIRHHQQLNAKVLMGVGALFVFLSGRKPRAPEWLRGLRLEWLFRLVNEPKRLFKRYSIDIIYFLYLCFKYK